MSTSQKSGTSGKPAQLDLWGKSHVEDWEDFRIAREYVRSFGIGNRNGWVDFVDKGGLKGRKIPHAPDQAYRHRGWKGWEDWLGKGENENTPDKDSSEDDRMKSLWSRKPGTKWINFHEARVKVWDLGFEYREEWELFVRGKFPDRKPLASTIPRDPDRVYRFVGWTGWKDWLIRPDQRIEYTGFYSARDFVRSNRIRDKQSWRDFLLERSSLMEVYRIRLPRRPHLEYNESGWVSWEDWLGTTIDYRDFRSTRKFIRSLKLRNRQEWNAFIGGRLRHRPKRSENIYAYPEIAYSDEGWTNWDDWLGPGTTEGMHPDSVDVPEGAKECICKGTLINCPDCDGKGYYFIP